MNKYAQIYALLAISLIVLVAQVSYGFSLITSTKTTPALGTIVYNTYTVSTLTELTNVVSKVVPGDVVLIRGGVYQPSRTDSLVFQRSGTSGNPITFMSYPGETAIIDGALTPDAEFWSPLVCVDGSWNVISNIEVRDSGGCGIVVNGDDCVLYHVEAHHNRGAGLNSYGDRCKFLYCVGHDNIDPQSSPPGENADGMGASSPANGCYFYKCVAYGNADDGIDCYGSTGNTIESCITYDNGRLQGNGCGFKGGVSSDQIYKCIAYNNWAEGYELNGPNSVIDHCTGYNNGLVITSKPDFTAQSSTITLSNNIGTVWYSPAPIQTSNTWNLGITNYGFISTDPSSPDFLSLSAGSLCRSKASDGSDLGALQYGERISDLLRT